jgi:hypothetical protein
VLVVYQGLQVLNYLGVQKRKEVVSYYQVPPLAYPCHELQEVQVLVGLGPYRRIPLSGRNTNVDIRLLVQLLLYSFFAYKLYGNKEDLLCEVSYKYIEKGAEAHYLVSLPIRLGAFAERSYRPVR